MYALDQQCHLYEWNLTEQTPHRKQLKQTNTRIPEYDHTVRKTNFETYGVNSIECTLSNGLILRNDKNHQFYHFLSENNKVSLIEQVKPLRAKTVKLNADTVIIIEKEDDTMTWYFYVYQASKQNIEHVSKIQLDSSECKFGVSHTREIIILTKEKLVLYDPKIDKQRDIPVKGLGKQMDIVTCDQGVCCVFSRDTLSYRGVCVTDNTLTVTDWTRKLSQNVDDSLDYITLTHDGNYILCVTNKKMLRLIRYSDGRLLALYTMYDHVCSLTVSTNNHYVLIGTSDKRLFTLVIADPRERDHDARIQHVRDENPGLKKEQAIALLGEASAFQDFDHDSDDDKENLDAAAQQVDKTRKPITKDLFCLQFDDKSSDESEENSRPPSIIAYEDGLQPTANGKLAFEDSNLDSSVNEELLHPAVEKVDKTLKYIPNDLFCRQSDDASLDERKKDDRQLARPKLQRGDTNIPSHTCSLL